ncbi:MAG: hypothetical protein MZV64_17715 [Ignavibacteriales bacterium]|nr:hypothetical protein [Ignavibacteriales bacterium]
MSGLGQVHADERHPLQRAGRASCTARTPSRGEHERIEGIEHLDKIINIDQSPIGRTPRSNPGTYTGLFDEIRKLFAELPESKVRGYKPGRFSFNVHGGRCEACQGQGELRIEMQFLPDVYVPCDVCHGTRFNRETLQVRFKGHNIADVLDMTVDQALEVFAHFPPMINKLQTAAGGGAGLCPRRPARDHAFGRRGAARQTGEGTLAPRHRAHPVRAG